MQHIKRALQWLGVAFGLLAEFLHARRLMPAAILGFAICLVLVLVSTRPETKPAERRERVWSVKAATVAYGQVQPTIKSYGQVVARRTLDLRALVAGEVIRTGRVLANGARVTKGEILLQIDPFAYETALADVRAQLKGARAVKQEREAAFELSKLDFIRTEKLFARGTVSQKIVDDKRTARDIAEARVTQQNATVERLRVAVKRAQRDLNNTKVRAPFDAFVSNVAAREGRLLNPNDRVATLTDATEYEVTFNLSDAEYGRFLQTGASLVGLPAKVEWVVGGQTLGFAARVVRVGAQISRTTRGVDVIAVIIDTVPLDLRAGAFVNVSLQGQIFENAFQISREALYPDNIVYAIVNGRLEPRRVELVSQTNETILIGGGLAAGEQVLLTRFNEAAPAVAVAVQ